MVKRFLFVNIFIVLAVSVVWCYRLLNLATSVSVDAHIYNAPIVVLDAGHGGFDGGAENKALGIVEKDINLKIAKKLEKLLVLCGFQTIMTRETDESTADSDADTTREKKSSDIHNRFALMTRSEVDIAVSIHLNKFEEEYVHGAQVFYAPNAKGSDVLAQKIQDSFSKNLQKDNKRKIKPSDSSIYILHKNTVNPTVMVECGFISNTQEGKLLLSEEYQSQIAITILAGILDYYSSENINNVS